MNQSNKEIFCPLPWMGYSIRNDGIVRVCCHANQGEHNGVLYKDDDTPYTYKDGINESRNSKTLKSIRKCILNNEWHPECKRCKLELNANMRSRNINETNIWKDYINKNKVLQLTKPDGTINIADFSLFHFDLRFGNLCNLKCRMCGCSDSSAWYKEYYEVLDQRFFNGNKIIKKNNKYYIKNDPFIWYDDDYFWEELTEHIKDIKFCYMVGGEPLLIKKHYEFLEKCISMEMARNIEIEYNTNATYIPDYAKLLWKHFKRVNFGVSLDATGELNEYIRYPSKWNVVENNIRKIDGFGSNVNLWLSATVMVYNILHMPDLFEWRLAQNYNKMMPIMSSHVLHTPTFLNIKLFPKLSKEYIKGYFKERISNFQKNISYSDTIKYEYKKMLMSYINFMFQEDFTYEIDKFLEYTNKIDESRGQSFEKTIPGLKELIIQK